MMFRAFFIGVFSAMMVLAGILPLNTAAQSGINLRALSRQILPSATSIKLPNVGAGKGISTISGSADKLVSLMWIKTDTTREFPAAVRLGDAVGDNRLTTTALSVAPNGVITYAWLSKSSGGPIKMRQRALDGSLSAEKNVVSVGSSAYLAVATNSTGTIVLAWSENSLFRYSYSTNNGANWSSPTMVSNNTSYNAPSLSVGPGGQIAIAFGDSEGDIHGGLWNGSGFTIESITSGGRSRSPFEANPSVTIDPTGVVYIAYQQVGGGYYYATRTSSGSWTTVHLSTMAVLGTAAIAADEAGNLTFVWASNSSGSRDLYVAYATASKVFEGPIHLPQSGVQVFDADVAASINGETLIHVALDSFTGSASTEYVQLSAQGSGSISATPAIETAAPLTKGAYRLVGNTQSVSVSFTDVAGSPTQVRWRWGAAPTDADSDSPGGWVNFTNPISVPLSNTVNAADCEPETLYTQVRNSTITQSDAKLATIIVDNIVSSSIRAVNPNISNKATVLTASPNAALADMLSDSGASDGDPNYTRVPIFYIEINGSSDCGSLSNFQFGASASTLGSPIGIVDNLFRSMQVLPNGGNIKDGPAPLTVQITDNLANLLTYTTVITYDSVKPVLQEPLSVTLDIIPSNPLATVLTDLQFSNVQVTDDYPGGYWGVWVANSLTPTNPLTDTALLWTPAKVDQAGTNPLLKNWSLATRLPVPISSLPPNTTFYVYVRFLDGAGNPTDEWITKSITLTNITLPRVNLPLVRR